MAAATLTGATADAMREAAANANGSMAGLMGMGMAMNAAGGMGTQNLYAMGAQQNAQNAGAAQSGWVCECGAQNTGNFCQNCGKPKNTAWVCECGAQNTGKFCQNCGKPKP